MEQIERTPTAVDALAEQWLDQLVELSPEMRVELGRDGDLAEYGDYSPDGANAAAESARSMLARVESAEPTDDVDRVTVSELRRTLTDQIEMHDAGFWQRDLNVIASATQGVRDIFDLMSTESAEDWDTIARRMHNVAGALDGHIVSLTAGIAAGRTPAIRQVRAVAAQAAEQASADSFFADLAKRGAEVGSAADLESGARAAAEAYGRLAKFLTDELAPHARESDAAGREDYALASRYFVGAEIDLDETYAWGVEELDRMVSEQESIADQIVPGGSVADAINALNSDPDRMLHGTDALQAWMQQVSDQAVADLGETHFEIPDIMRRLECCIAPTHTGGIYYTPPSDDFGRPGRMWWSVPEGDTEFPTWETLTTVYHEGVPGHHLQCGLAVFHAATLNSWRRVNWNSGHGEGWALYAERLMQDLGYLDDAGNRLGMLDAQRMRAARVVIDLGVHLELPKPDGSGAWTGDDAYRFLGQHASVSDAMVRFESDRYLGWPGQAPSYKVGQRLWEQLRDDWVSANGDDLRDFHGQALALGGIGMGTMREVMLG